MITYPHDPTKPNRIEIAIAKIEQAIKDKNLDQPTLDKLNKQLDMEFGEYASFQELKSCASLDGTLSLDEANLIYHYLGNIPDQFNRQSVAVKTVLTQTYASLLKRRIKAQAR